MKHWGDEAYLEVPRPRGCVNEWILESTPRVGTSSQDGSVGGEAGTHLCPLSLPCLGWHSYTGLTRCPLSLGFSAPEPSYLSAHYKFSHKYLAIAWTETPTWPQSLRSLRTGPSEMLWGQHQMALTQPLLWQPMSPWLHREPPLPHSTATPL